MDFTTLQDRVKFVVDNNDNQTSQAFSATRVKQAINWAYRQEVNQAQLEGGRRWFITTKEKTWLADETTFELPDGLEDKRLISVENVTDTDPGDPLIFDESGTSGEVFWKNRLTLQWGTSGPSSDVTMRFRYYAVPDELDQDDDVPSLLPEMFHELLIWSAAILLLEIADQAAPGTWMANRREMRMDMWKWMSTGRPMSDVPRISNIESDSDDGLL
jgi:hypothetical protein